MQFNESNFHYFSILDSSVTPVKNYKELEISIKINKPFMCIRKRTYTL